MPPRGACLCGCVQRHPNARDTRSMRCGVAIRGWTTIQSGRLLHGQSFHEVTWQLRYRGRGCAGLRPSGNQGLGRSRPGELRSGHGRTRGRQARLRAPSRPVRISAAHSAPPQVAGSVGRPHVRGGDRSLSAAASEVAKEASMRPPLQPPSGESCVECGWSSGARAGLLAV